MQISALSTQYVKVKVEAVVNGIETDPTADSVVMAFKASGPPAGGDWQTASWESATQTTAYYARCLVGPGGTITLSTGDYHVWVKITDSPEVPVFMAGTLSVT